MTGFESVVGVDPWTALFTFLNMIITFLLLRKFLFKPVKKMIDDRQSEIDDIYKDAETKNSEAEALRAEYENDLREAKSRREEIIREATQEAQKREQEIISAARDDAAAMRKKAESDIAQEKKKALNEMKNDISGIAMDIAEKVVEKEISPADHAALVEDFIAKLGEEK